MAESVLVARVDSVTTVTINRPQARNACDMATVKRLHDVFQDFEDDARQLVAVLTGAANGGFCAGHAGMAPLSTIDTSEPMK